MPINPQITLDELSADLAEGKITLAEAHEVLLPRSKRKDSRSGKRAKAWMQAHPLPKAPAKAKPAKVTPKARKQAMTAAVKTYATYKAQAWDAACMWSLLVTGAFERSGEFWDAYKAATKEHRALVNA